MKLVNLTYISFSRRPQHDDLVNFSIRTRVALPHFRHCFLRPAQGLPKVIPGRRLRSTGLP
jgi:hypothetical protein